MKKLKWFLLAVLIPIILPFFLIIILAVATAGSPTGGSGLDGATYAEHWSSGDPYTHNLLVHRYGITAAQLDGFLDTLGISYDKNRINGRKLLEWEAKSNLDVRGIVAIALNESSLGTAGVARNPGANMFGYGAFDSNPENANNFNDEVAVVALTQQTIIGNKNETFKIQDDKAQKYANGSLNQTIDGGGVTSNDIPVGYSLTKAIDTNGYVTSTYPWGECTWYVFNRGKQVGVNFDPFMGNGGQWMNKPGFTTTHTPTEHSALSFSPGQAGADPIYGHIAFVEQVKSDGSILISECNVKGLGVISYRTFDGQTAKQFTYVLGN